MKNRALNIIIFLFVLSLQLKAQINLVPNYSFEEKDSCPAFHSELTPTCKEWFDPVSKMFIPPPPPFPPIYGARGSANYYHKCGGTQVDIPNNLEGNQYPLTGDAYAGIIVVYQDSNLLYFNQLHEYIEVELIESLNRNTKYYAEFYYSIAEAYSNGTPNFFLNNLKFVELGMLLTDTLVRRASGITMPQPQNICATAQVSQMMGPQIDTINWIKVSGSFTAKGGEKFLTIGSFIDLDTLIGDVWTYIFIDDVKVWQVEDTLQSDVNKYLKVYPIPTFTDKTITFEYVNGDLQGYDLLIYNSLGQRVFKYHFESSISKQRFPFMNLATGVYYYSLRHNDDTNFSGKLIILK